MSLRDDELGMARPISRRDFLNGALNGAASAAAGTLLSGCVDPIRLGERPPPPDPAVYPPARVGMRGSHPGSFEVAHELVLQKRRDWGPVHDADDGVYDLVVVGGGISGLSAAYFRWREDPDARILVLENHDDFGGHARRNEFRLGDRVVLGYGGSQTLEDPGYYSAVAQGLLRDIGVRLDRFDSAYDRDFYRRHGLAGGIFFDRAHYGVDRLVRYEVLDYSGYMPLAPGRLSARQAVEGMPLGAAARAELLALLEADEDRLGHVPVAEREAYLARISYRSFLEKHCGVTQPEVFALLEGISADIGVTLDAAPALGMLDYVGLPGARAAGLERGGFEQTPYIAHFPDGNASIARLLVRAMNPAVANGDGTDWPAWLSFGNAFSPYGRMEDIVGARFDYARLDEPTARLRIRLNSTVVHVAHEGPPASADGVEVRYVRGGRAERVRARACVLAGYNAMIPHLCPELPARQREALALSVKSPILYSSVLLNNWRAWKQLGIGAACAPGSYHTNAMLDFPVTLGSQSLPDSPDEPIVVHMERFGKVSPPGTHPHEQYRAERRSLLEKTFEAIEREIRTHLAGMLAAGGFDPARDIEAITVNRWAHGYSPYYPNPLHDAADGADPPHVVARARFGRIAIANADAGARATIDTAIDQAHRATRELSEG